MIWASTRDGCITYAGPECTVFTSQSRDAALGDGWLEMLHVEDRASTDTFFKEACASMAAFTIEYRLRHVSGGYIRVVAGDVVDLAGRSFLYRLSRHDQRDRGGRRTEHLPQDDHRAAEQGDEAGYLDRHHRRLPAARAGDGTASRETRLLASIDFAISEIMRRLGYRAAAAGRH